MKRNTLGRIATILGLAAGVLGVFADRGAAQIIRQVVVLPPPPTRPSPNDLMEIAAGENHTCVRKFSGVVLCWGLDRAGELGVANTNNCFDSGPQVNAPCVDKPAVIPLLPASSQIVAGGDHTCSLSGGIVSCWGSNSFGELGDGTTIIRSSPQNIAGGLQFTKIAAAPSATCGLSSVGAFCWGILPYGAQPTGAISMGIGGHQFEALSPAQISSSAGFKAVSVGYQVACFTENAGGNDCQGRNDFGQLGVDSSFLPSDTFNPGTIFSFTIPFAPFLVRSSAGAGVNVSRSAAGPDYVCADVSDGTVQCVGSNSGQVVSSAPGASTIQGSNLSQAVKVTDSMGNVLQLRGVTTGSAHACALDGSGAAWCWGSNGRGELGNSTTTASTAFAVPVAGNLKFRSLAAGMLHTCGIGTDNNVYCWGDDQDGQLGIGYHSLGLNPDNTTVTFTTTPHQLAPL